MASISASMSSGHGPSSLDSWLPWLNSRWDEGARNVLALCREMKVEGFPGRSGVVSQWAQRRAGS